MYLITTQDLLALENTKDFLETAGVRGKGADRIQVLLNKVPVRQKPDLDNLEKYLGVRPAGVFSDDTEALYETWSEGRLLGTNSVLGRQLTSLAKSVMIPEPPANAATEAKGSDKKPAVPASTAAGLGRFFSFMRSSRA